MPIQEWIVMAYKTNPETFFGPTNKTFEGVKKLVELGLRVVEAALIKNVKHARKVPTVKDA